MGGFINKHENKNTITMPARVNDEQIFKKSIIKCGKKLRS